MMASSSPVLPFDLYEDQTSVGIRWSKWLARFENFMVTINVTDLQRKKASLLHYGGEQVFDVHSTLDITPRDITPLNAAQGAPRVLEDAYQASVRALNEYFNPRKNTDFDIFLFRQAQQYEGESIDAFHTRLQQLANNCGWNGAEKSKEVKAQIMLGCSSTDLRRKVLEKPTLSLDQVVSKGRAIEAAEAQTRRIEEGAETVAAISPKHHKHATSGYNKSKSIQGKEDAHSESPTSDQVYESKFQNQTCWNCGGERHPNTRCPARFHQCTNCLYLHHFEQFCRNEPQQRHSVASISSRVPKASTSKKQHVRFITSDESSTSDDDDIACAVSPADHRDSSCVVFFRDVPVAVTADTGSTVTILNEKAYKSLGSPALSEHLKPVYTLDPDKPLCIEGKFEVPVYFHGNRHVITALVCQKARLNVLSKTVAIQLGIVKMALTSASQEIATEELQDVIKPQKKVTKLTEPTSLLPTEDPAKPPKESPCKKRKAYCFSNFKRARVAILPHEDLPTLLNRGNSEPSYRGTLQLPYEEKSERVKDLKQPPSSRKRARKKPSRLFSFRFGGKTASRRVHPE